jgi:hypothetical protein
VGARRILGWIAGLSLASAASAQQWQIQFAEPVNLDASTGAVQFDAYGRHFSLSLQNNDRLLKALPSKQRTAAARAQLIRGKLEGATGSWVRLSRVGGVLEGAIWDGHEMYVVTSYQRIAHSLALPLEVAPTQTVIFRLSDATNGLPAEYCGTEQTLPRSRGNTPTMLKQFQDVVRELRFNAMAAPTEQLDIALIGDTAFQAQFGANATDTMLARLNIVDGIFAEQVGVLILPSELRLVSGNDPFTATEPSDLLQQVAAYREGDEAIRTPGLAHLMTGKTLNGDVIGIAYVDALCEQREGVSLSESSWGDFLSALIMAHELGHNFGARHDGVPGVCESTPQSYLMAPALNSSSQFSQCSLDSMAPNIERARGVCLAPASYADVAVQLPASPFNVDTSATFSLPVSVRSMGNLDADEVRLEVELPPQLGFQSAVVDGGSCEATGNLVRCTLGDMAAGAQRDVELRLSSTSLGSYYVQARVAADNDYLVGNNTGNVIVGLQSAVDLGLSLGFTPGLLYVGDPIEFTFDVSSLRSQAAVGGRLNINMGSIGVDAITAGSHACVVDPIFTGQVTCQLADVPSGTTTRIVVRGHATSASYYGLSASVDVLNDGDFANNHAFVNFNVLAERQVVLTVSTEDLRAVIGAPYDITYTLTSVGRSAATDVKLELLSGFGIVEAVTPGEGSCTPPGPQVNAVCDFGTLDPGETRTVVARVRTTEAGSLVLIGRAAYLNGATQEYAWTHTWIYSAFRVDATADLYQFVYVLNEGQAAFTGILVSSPGVDPAQNVVATLDLPAPVRLTRFEMASGAPAGWTCAIVTPQQGRCTGSFASGSLNAWATIHLEFLSDTPVEGQATLTVAADEDANPDNNVKTATIRVQQYLDVSVTAASFNKTFIVGELGLAEYTVRTGVNPVPAVKLWPSLSNLYIELDSLSVNGVDCPLTAEPPGPWLSNGCDLGDLPAGASVPVTVRYRAIEADRSGQIQLLSTTTRDSNSSNDVGWVNYTTQQLTDLQLTLAATAMSANNGAQARFPLITVSNGASTARNVTVEIPIPSFASVDVVSSSGLCSGTTVLSCSWSSLAPGANATIDLYLRGTGAGTFTSNVVLRADNDATATNNGAAVSVTFVTPPPSGGGGGGGSSSGGGKKGGGGGSLEWLSLGALGLLLYRRRRIAQ